MTVESVPIHKFERSPDAGVEPTSGFLVVKSQDQLKRRKRLINQLDNGELGRVERRPVGEGLLVRFELPLTGPRLDRETASWTKSFDECRHITQVEDNKYLLTEMGRVHLIDFGGMVQRTYDHPYFGFLHTVQRSEDGDRILIASSGYDAIIELELESGEETWSWFGWEHGFNPNEKGIYFARSEEEKECLQHDGHEVQFVDPEAYGRRGLITRDRTTIPNACRYDPRKKNTIIASIGKNGLIVRIDKRTGKYTVLYEDLDQMPHGIYPLEEGWGVTDTLKGQFLEFDRAFSPIRRYDFSQLGGKPEPLADREWLQQVIPVTSNKWIALDANRGLMFVDLERERYEIQKVDENWCMQDLLLL